MGALRELAQPFYRERRTYPIQPDSARTPRRHGGIRAKGSSGGGAWGPLSALAAEARRH